MLRGAALHDRVTARRAGAPGGAAHVEVVAALDTLESAAAGAPGAGREPVLVDGEPVTAALARELLERLDALCPGGLQAPTDGTLMISVTDAGGRLLAAVTRRELEAAVRRGQGLGPPPAVDRYGPSPGPAAVRHAPGTAPAGIPAAATGPAGPTSTTSLAHAEGGETDCANLCCLCRRHHRLKTHAAGWRYAMTPDGVLTSPRPAGSPGSADHRA